MINTLGHLAMAPEETAILDKILARHAKDAGPLIPVLQDVQRQFSYLSGKPGLHRSGSKDPFERCLRHRQLRPVLFSPRGENMVGFAGNGLPCAGSEDPGRLCRRFGDRCWRTTADGKFSLERVACVGSCGWPRWS